MHEEACVKDLRKSQVGRHEILKEINESIVSYVSLLDEDMRMIEKLQTQSSFFMDEVCSYMETLRGEKAKVEALQAEFASFVKNACDAETELCRLELARKKYAT